MKTDTLENRTLRTTTVLQAPIAAVWEAWTNPEEIVHWWGPAGFITTILQMNVKEGAEWLLTLHGPDGKNYPNKAVFREVIEHKKIVYEHFNPDFMTTVLFEPQGDRTLMKWTVVFETQELFDIVVKTFKAGEGQKQNVEKLGRYLAKKMQQE